MREVSIHRIEAASRTIAEVLRTDFNWSHLGFVDGMSPITYRGGRQVWRPKTKLLARLVGGSNGPLVALEQVVKPGCFLKFCLPNDTIQRTLDFQNWRGFFDRETVYSSTGSGYILDRWLRFVSFRENGFRFESEYLDVSVRANTPTVAFFGAEWIRVASPDCLNG